MLKVGPSAKARRGFTLIELLVVISIVGLLMALLLPALRNARHAANRTLCGVKIRSAGISFLAYAEDHKQWVFMMRVVTTVVSNQRLSPRWEPSVSTSSGQFSNFFPQDHPSAKIPTTSYMREAWGRAAARHCPELTPQALGWDPTLAENDFHFGYAAPLLNNANAARGVMMDRRSSHYVRLTPGRAYGNRAASGTAAQFADPGSFFTTYNYDPTETVPLLNDWLQTGSIAEGQHRMAPHNMNVAHQLGTNRIDSRGAWSFFLDGTTEWTEFPESARGLPTSDQPSVSSDIVSFPYEVLGISPTTRPGVIWTRSGSEGHMYYFPVRRKLRY